MQCFDHDSSQAPGSSTLGGSVEQLVGGATNVFEAGGLEDYFRDLDPICPWEHVNAARVDFPCLDAHSPMWEAKIQPGEMGKTPLVYLCWFPLKTPIMTSWRRLSQPCWHLPVPARKPHSICEYSRSCHWPDGTESPRERWIVLGKDGPPIFGAFRSENIAPEILDQCLPICVYEEINLKLKILTFCRVFLPHSDSSISPLCQFFSLYLGLSVKSLSNHLFSLWSNSS